jgi:glycosyltransferase involved in cell wall biosynthesis
VLSLYPTLSGTFIEREITALRDLGVEVLTISVNSPSAQDLLSRRHRDERARTQYVKSLGRRRIAGAVASLALRHPWAFATVARRAVRTGGLDVRAVAWRAFYLAEAVVVLRACRRAGVRHLHAHFGHGAAFVAWFATELGRALEPTARWTWSFTVHGWLEFLNEQAESMRSKIEAADLTVAISDHTRSQLMRSSDPSVWHRIERVHCSVDIERFGFQPRPARAGRAVVLTVARLAPEKGHLVLLDALRQLVDRGRDVELLLAGAGPFRDVVAAQVTALGLDERVRFLGPVGQDDLVELLDRADVFVLPSFAEGLPVALMEALARGVPAVATALAGIPELIEDRVTGRLVPPARPDALADAIEDLLDDDVLRARVQHAGRRLVESEFTARSNARCLADAFRRCVRPT